MSVKNRRITVEQAAKLMGASPRYVREMMREGRLDIGEAYQRDGNQNWTFYISPSLLAEHLGVPVSALYDFDVKESEDVTLSEEQISMLCMSFEKFLRSGAVAAIFGGSPNGQQETV